MIFFRSHHLRMVSLVLALLLVAEAFGTTPAQASAEKADWIVTHDSSATGSPIFLPVATSQQNDVVSAEADCDPNSGSMWVDGPLQPDIATQVEDALNQWGSMQLSRREVTAKSMVVKHIHIVG